MRIFDRTKARPLGGKQQNPRRPLPPLACGVSLLLLMSPLSGCFREQTIPIEPSRIIHLAPAAHPESTRDWLAGARDRLQPLLPRRHLPPLIDDELLTNDGRPIDVYRHFRTDPKTLHGIFTNFFGLLYTAQASHTTVADHEPPPWDGFQDVWIPVADGVKLFGRLGFAERDGKPIRSDCIVILPGLLGDLSVERTRTLALALRDAGLHALAIELRGFGRTDERFPNVYYNFGVLETGDLMAVAEWLQARPEVRRTGLIGFCWGANHALLAAWDDGRADDHPSVSARLKPCLRPRSGARHYEAGVLAFSPVLSFENIVDRCDRPISAWCDPVGAALQQGIRERKQLKHHEPCDGNLRTLIEEEFARSPLRYEGGVRDGFNYLRLLPYRDQDGGDKLESARVPVLVVQASNDPLGPAQDVAALAATTSNPNVAFMVLEGGGHVGFAPYARDWYYSLILNYFDPKAGAETSRRGSSEERGAR